MSLTLRMKCHLEQPFTLKTLTVHWLLNELTELMPEFYFESLLVPVLIIYANSQVGAGFKSQGHTPSSLALALPLRSG